MQLPAWPKGPFPARYTAPAVFSRLEGAWLTEGRAAALASLSPAPELVDPYLRFVVGDLESVRHALGTAPVHAFGWRRGARDDRGSSDVIGLSPSADPVEAIVAVGVASPEHGIGTAALVRFATTLRGMCTSVSIDVLAEDAIEIALEPRTVEAALRIAARARELCVPLAARVELDVLATSLRVGNPLVLAWR